MGLYSLVRGLIWAYNRRGLYPGDIGIKKMFRNVRDTFFIYWYLVRIGELIIGSNILFTGRWPLNRGGRGKGLISRRAYERQLMVFVLIFEFHARGISFDAGSSIAGTRTDFHKVLSFRTNNLFYNVTELFIWFYYL